MKKVIIYWMFVVILCGCATTGTNAAKPDSKSGINVTSTPPECGVILCQGDRKTFLGTTPLTFNPSIFLKSGELGWIIVSHRGYKSASVPIGQEMKPIEITLDRREDTSLESVSPKQISICLLQISGFRGSKAAERDDIEIENSRKLLLNYFQEGTFSQKYKLEISEGSREIPIEKCELLISQFDIALKGLLPEAMPYYSRLPAIKDKESLTILAEMSKAQESDAILCIYGAACFKPAGQKFGEALMWGSMVTLAVVAAGEGYTVTPQPGQRYFWEGTTDKAIPKDRDGIALTAVIVRPENGEILAFGKAYQPGRCTDKNVIKEVTEDILLVINQNLLK
ncbi:MAG: hypothetical protein AB1422_07340 [bacterium]